jgi:hypothetical protein
MKISIKKNGSQINHLAWGVKRRHGLTWKQAITHAFDALRMKQRLSTAIVNFSFTKVSDGTTRIAKGTRDLGLIPSSKHPKKESAPKSTNVVNYFDLGANDWRSFDISNLNPSLI